MMLVMEDATPPRSPGRPPHVPTDETRAQVADLVSRDANIATIAAAIGISEPTLHLHYAVELASRPQLNFPFAEIPAAQPARPSSQPQGRPAHEPTPESREQVEILVASGMRAWQIAAAIGITEPTLNRHYADELQHGRARRTAAMVIAQYRAGQEGNVSAQKAWLSTNHAIERAPPVAEEVRPGQLGKKAALAQAAQVVGRGKFATPAPPLKLVSSNG